MTSITNTESHAKFYLEVEHPEAQAYYEAVEQSKQELARAEAEYRHIMIHGRGVLDVLRLETLEKHIASRSTPTRFIAKVGKPNKVCRICARICAFFRKRNKICAGSNETENHESERILLIEGNFRSIPKSSLMTIWLDSRQIEVSPAMTVADVVDNYLPHDFDGWLQFNGKPLRSHIMLHDYGILGGCRLETRLRLLGGSITKTNIVLPTYHIVAECEEQLRRELLRLQASEFSADGEDPEDVESKLFSLLTSIMEPLKASAGEDNAWMCDLIENFVQIAFWSRKCSGKADYLALMALAYRLLTGKAIVSSLWKTFDISSNVQADTFTDVLRVARNMFNMSEELLRSPLVKKVRKIYTYMLVQGFLNHLGMGMSPEEYLQLDAKTKVTYSNHSNMVVCIIETALSVCERIDAYRMTGDWTALVHENATYQKWAKEVDRLISLGPFTSNLEAHGTTYFEFVSDINACLERGEAICKYSAKNNGVESFNMRKKLNSVHMLKNIEITRRAAQKERKSPMGVLIHGGSSVGKSSFTKMMFYYYGQINGLNVDDHYRYVRNPTDEYWSNFDSSKWCVQMDDIAFLLPSKTPEVDATLKEMLNVVNNVPYVPPQAALEDKGKTPVMAKLVLATTNSPTLNALDYFFCPLAVRRRLPYVVKVEPKDEFLHSNGRFLDPRKIPPPQGKFPDLWKITVQKLIPMDHNGRDSAALRDIEVFDGPGASMNFLKHFAKASEEHEASQQNSDAYDADMKGIKVCRLCYNVTEDCACVQAFAVGAFTRLTLMYNAWAWVELIWAVCLVGFLQATINWLVAFGVYRVAMARLARWTNWETEFHIQCALNRGRGLRFTLSFKKFLIVANVVCRTLLCYKAAQFAWNWSKPREKRGFFHYIHVPDATEPADSGARKQDVATCAREGCECDPEGLCDVCNDALSHNSSEEEWDPEIQGNVLDKTEDQLEKESRQNVWYKADMDISTFDVPPASLSNAHMSDDDVRNLFSANLVRLDVKNDVSSTGMRVSGVFLRGQYLLFNLHALANGSKFRVTIIEANTSRGVTSNLDVSFGIDEVRALRDRDMAVVRIKNIPPRKDILKFWNTGHTLPSRLLSLRRENDGAVHLGYVSNCSYQEDFPIEELGISAKLYMGTANADTKKGDCGGLGILNYGQGPIVMGLHILGYQKMAAFMHVTRSELLPLCSDGELCVQGGGQARVALNPRTSLLPLHFKSVFRYLPEGAVRVYGTIPGFRAKPRSRVCGTPLQTKMREHFNCDLNYGPPVMRGWEPVYNNAKEMVKPHTDIDQKLLDHCVEAFSKDIITGLDATQPEWRGDLVFLTRKASVNGLPGVKFIDRINTSSSMGHPWNRSKKHFLEEARDEKYPEGVDFSEEIWAMVDEIESKYKEGKRAYPVFTAHLKDEPVSLSKIEIKKTRIFTGAPIDWSLVVRSRLLSFVRLLQKNKEIFEAAPGTVAQSSEWTAIYRYLTKFGVDQIIGGDYGKFDKRMIAAMVLAAFEVITNIYREAGFSPEECLEIMCIGHDTAFPVTNMSGDLAEFYGTNPSGHPLTVIVNSIVNSLYMRYAYCKLNPASETCWDFKTFVSLMTYGDDNGMGVSKLTQWFNHTAIQKELAKIGVEYTMADKTAESIPYIHIRDFSFLKRKWRYEPQLGFYACPLEEDSIHKSLTMWVPSSSPLMDKYKQMVAVVSAANSEYFFHGQEVFEKHHAFFKEVLSEEPYCLYVTEATLPGWETLCERFRDASSEFEDIKPEFPPTTVGVGASAVVNSIV
jgi:hypothetical protein